MSLLREVPLEVGRRRSRKVQQCDRLCVGEMRSVVAVRQQAPGGDLYGGAQQCMSKRHGVNGA